MLNFQELEAVCWPHEYPAKQAEKSLLQVDM